MSRAYALTIALILGAPAVARSQACPCHSVNATPNAQNCGVEAVAGTNPTVTEWQPIFEEVAHGPAGWGTQGPPLGDIGQGCGKPEPAHAVAPVFPCELLRAIAMVETGWRQFCTPTLPASQVGLSSSTIISFDCGYGIGQVTSGMHVGETPSFDRARVAAEPIHNLATGTQILAAKWSATNCVGDNQPRVVEDWYVATWAYNGLSAVNNPNTPNYDAMRPVCDPSKGCAGRPYQERVWGYLEHPPTAAHWTPLLPAYPDRGDIGMAVKPPSLPEPGCAGPTDCVARRPIHHSACLGDEEGNDGGAAPAGDLATSADLSAPDGMNGMNGMNGAGSCGCQLGTHTPTRAPGLLWLTLGSWLFVRRSRVRRHPG